ncbi:hypothetical protein [Streptomyces sp. NPDC086989]
MTCKPLKDELPVTATHVPDRTAYARHPLPFSATVSAITDLGRRLT